MNFGLSDKKMGSIDDAIERSEKLHLLYVHEPSITYAFNVQV